MSKGSDLIDEELRREVSRQRFATRLERTEIAPTTQALSRSLPRIISGFDFETMTRSDLNRLTVELRAEFGATWSTMWWDITDELAEMAQLEAVAVTGEYAAFTGTPLAAPTEKAVEVGARTAVMTLTGDVSQIGVWAEFVARNEGSTMRGIAGIIREGFNSNLTRQEIIKQLRGTYNRRTKKYMGGFLNGKTRAQADALTRTGVSHYANVARDAFAAKNASVIEGRILFATLDNRTTKICFRRHLNFYETGERFPPLPFHFNERSQYIFKTPGFDPLATDRPTVGGKEGQAAAEKFEAKQGRTDKKVRHRGRADTDIFDVEMVEARLTADAWLRRQPRWFIESSLGKERARLFVDGGLKIDRFTDLVGRELTLDELKQTNAGERANRKADKV